MKVPIHWLKEYLDFSLSPQELADVLTLAGIEVEGIERTPLPFTGVVVGEVLETHRHPNAEHLTIAKVSNGKEHLQIVCGAPNCRPGIKVALALIGASLEGGAFKIKKSKLRDVESFGMLCAADELGIGEEHDKIMELPAHLMVGMDLSEMYSEVILDISLTPNLGHCMSIFGLARELSALLNIPLKKHPFTIVEEGPAIDKLIHLSVIDRRQCLRYACRIVRGIRVGPSPEWIQKKLSACGMRSINNVVDVSNLVMLELGQPLHFFDYHKIAGKKIIVNSQTSFSELETLDDIMRVIPQETLLICDEEKPLAFAGIMGGKSSAVTETTCDVLIESASFSAQSVRRSCKWLDLRTEGAQRHEKGIDPNGVVHAINYAAYLLQQVAGGEIIPGVIDHKSHEFHPKKVTCRLARANALLGTALSLREIVDLLKRLGMTIIEEKGESLVALVPTFRNDISIEEDLIEEIARLYGYNNIARPTPRHVTSAIPHSPNYLFEAQMRARLMGEGLQEFLNCDLISPSQAQMLMENSMSQESAITVLHSKSQEQSVLRASLLPGLLQVIKYNIDHYQPDVAGFEIGKIYFKEGERFLEQPMAGIVMTGKKAPYHWDPKPQECDFFDLKGAAENLFQAQRIHNVTFEVSHLHNFHPGRQARIKIGDECIGVIGEVHPEHLQKMGIEQKVYFAELNLQLLQAHVAQMSKVVDPLLYPGSERDWTMTLKEEIPIERIFAGIRGVPSRLLEKVSLLGLYKSAQIGKDRKNVTFRFFYRDPERTLAFEAVEKEHARIVQTVAESLKAFLF